MEFSRTVMFIGLLAMTPMSHAESMSEAPSPTTTTSSDSTAKDSSTTTSASTTTTDLDMTTDKISSTTTAKEPQDISNQTSQTTTTDMSSIATPSIVLDTTTEGTSTTTSASSTTTYSNMTTDEMTSTTTAEEPQVITNQTSQTTTTTDMATTATTLTVIDTTTQNPCDSKSCNNGTCDMQDGTAVCICNPGYTGLDCETDINECDESPCHVWANCNNTEGSYNCKCKTGFTGNGTVCEDVNECSNSSTHNCSVHASCTNTNGSYACSCKKGWTGNGYECTDIDECLDKPCDVWANCTNTNGSYICTCESGFTGNGTYCLDINECDGNHSCNESNTQECINLAQNYFCLCERGWKGDYCTEEDDLCDNARNPCSPNATCSYNETGPHCVCKEQFKGDGTTCYLKVLFEKDPYTDKAVGDDNILGPYDVDGGIPYNGQLYFRIYISMNGYLTLGQRLNRSYPDIERLTSEASLPIIAPLWADIETNSERGGLYVNSTLDPTDTNKYFDNRLANPRFAFMATWIGAVPYPYEQNNCSESADFQVILITNGSETDVMFNYDQENFSWQISPGRKVAVGLTNNNAWNLIANEDNFTKMNEFINVNDQDIKGRHIVEVLNNDPNLQAEAECYYWFKSVDSDKLSRELADADYCPCSLAQAARDRRFKNLGGNVYQSRFARGPYGSKQTCNYSSIGALTTGIPNGGYLETSIDTLSTTDGYTKCCESSTRLCYRFYETVPSQNCSGYNPPSWSLAWGDPHLQTIDGQTYTFNGRGEYTLLEYMSPTRSENIEIQVRTDYVNENRKDATVFVGLALKVGNGSILELNLNRSSNSSNLYINGIYNATFDGTKSVEIDVDDIQLFNVTSDLIIVTRPGIAVKVEVSNILDITTFVPREKSFIGNTRGLLGNNDKNDTNDFVSRNGTVSYPANSNESTIYDFASSWRVSNTTSLFNYTINGPFEYYNNISSTLPVFISELENITEYMNETCGKPINLSFCNNDSECITDTVATCDPDIGMRTKQSLESAEQEAAILKNDPPRLTSSADPTIYIGFNLNNSWSRNLREFFTDDDVIRISNNISLGDFYTLDNDTFSLNISSLPRNLTDHLYLKFIATDTFNASTEFWPNIYYCGCEREEECDYTTFRLSTEDRFYVASCNCSDDYIGDYCEIKNCNCYNVVNWSTCKCGCPPGMKNDSQKCYDKDECKEDASLCQGPGQYCSNIPGNYSCECLPGYYKEDKSCIKDKDECQDNTSLCQGPGQYCSNIPGNYSCECLPGYYKEDKSCIKDKDECQDNTSLCQGPGQYCSNIPGNYSCECLPGYYKEDKSCIKVNQSFAGILIFDVIFKNSRIQDVAKMWVEEIFDHLGKMIVEVYEESTEKNTRRKKRETETRYKYSFVLHPTSLINETTVIDAFNEYKKKHTDLPDLIRGNVVQMDTNESRIYTDVEHGICNAQGKTDCDSISTNCVTSDGVFSCHCKIGFERLPVSQKRCSDIDECTQNNSICQHGNCTNTPGSFDCSCNPGFVLQGTICQDTCQSNPCKNDGLCTHGTLEGQYICKCNDKWTGATCETENSEISKLRTIAIAVGASVGCVCILLLIAMFGMYRRHRKRRFPYSRRPLSSLDDFDNGLSDTNLRYHKDMPLDDGDTYDNGTTFDMPRIPRAKLRESEYNAIEDKSELGGPRQKNDESRPLASDKRRSADSDKFGKSNPSFLHEDGERASTRKGGNHYEYF